MDLMCVSSNKVGIMIAIYSIFYTLGALFHKVPGKIGRKKTVMISAGISVVAQTIMLYADSMLSRTICFSVVGISNAVKAGISYVWLAECVPKPLKA